MLSTTRRCVAPHYLCEVLIARCQIPTLSIIIHLLFYSEHGVVGAAGRRVGQSRAVARRGRTVS